MVCRNYQNKMVTAFFHLITKQSVVKTLKYLTVKKEADYTFTEKKSRFIGYIKPCETEQQAIEYINFIKKKHSDARHNVYAYVLRENNKQRYSDDGEPQGTGGLPVLETILKKGLTDVCVVVTRYFGGILLGTGGLTRAYSGGCKGAIECSGIAEMTECSCFEIECDYACFNTLQSIFSSFSLIIESSEFSDNVKLCCVIKDEEYELLYEEILERFAGKIKPQFKNKKYFLFDVK